MIQHVMATMDPRDFLLSDLHRDWLKPMGFRKKGRRCEKQAEDDLLVSVVLESGPRTPFGPIHFALDLRATHSSLPKNRGLVCVSLPLHVEKLQRWTIKDDASVDELLEEVKNIFSTVALDLLCRMSSLSQLTDLLAELDSVWYYDSRAWCLDRLGRHEEAMRVIRDAVNRAPHENFRNHALLLLEKRVALGDR